SQHDRHRRTVNIAVQQSHLGALSGEGRRDVHGNGGFSDAALAAADSYDVLHTLQCGAVHLRGGPNFRGHVDRDITDSGKPLDESNRLVTHLVFYRTGGRGEIQIECNVAFVDLEIADEPQSDDVLMQVGILNPL